MAANATFALKAGVWFRRARLVMLSPDPRQSAPPSGRKSTYPAVQFPQASSLQRLDEGERPVALAARDREDLRLGARRLVPVDRPPIDNPEAFGPHRLDPEVVDPGSDGAFDPGAQQILEDAEERVLQVDGQRQQAVEERGDRRQVFAQRAIAVDQPQARGGLECLERTARD